jgi:superfamily II DNA or RNA helicase
MRLLLDNQKTCFILTPEEKEKILPIIISRFSEKDMTNAFAGGTFHKDKIKIVKFVKKVKDVYWLSNGFTKEFLLLIKENGWKVDEVLDKRERFPFQKKEWSDEEIKSYLPNFDYVEHQVRTLKKILKTSNGIAQLPTSAGKGDIILSFMKIIKIPTIVIVNKVMLCEQLFERFEKGGLKNIGLITGSKTKNINGDIIVATIGSIGKVPALHKFKCLLIDEVHNASAKTFQNFLEKFSPPIKIGFSATPNKGDSYNFMKIKQFLGDVIIKVESSELLENKVMAKPIIYFIKNECENIPDFQASYLHEIIKNKRRNEIIIEISKNFNLQTVILLQDVVNGQGEYLLEKIKESGKSVEFISGNTKNRNEIIDLFEKEEINVLIATNILNEGVSIKNISVLINASAMKSFSATAQKIGRSLRIKDGKTSAAIIDFTDSGNRYLEKH